MIKMIVLVRRNPKLTREEFTNLWLNGHGELVKTVPPLTRYIRKYVQNHLIDAATEGSSAAADSMGGLARPSGEYDFDGIVETWYNEVDDIARSGMSEDYMRIIRPDELELIDAERCVMYLTQEHIMFDEDNRPSAEIEMARSAE